MPTRKLDVEKFRRLLLGERADLEAQARRIATRDSSADQSDETGDLADYDNHPADSASETFEREKDLALDENVSRMLGTVDRALQKIDEGNYGICDRCGTEIGRERLSALPHAVFCIQCQDVMEGR